GVAEGFWAGVAAWAVARGIAVEAAGLPFGSEGATVDMYHRGATYDSSDYPLIAQRGVALREPAAWFAGARVLELGCGTGRNAGWCVAVGARAYVGVDASEAKLEEARRRVTDARASFVSAPLALAAAGGDFDVVLVCLVLEQIEEVGAAFRAAA